MAGGRSRRHWAQWINAVIVSVIKCSQSSVYWSMVLSLCENQPSSVSLRWSGLCTDQATVVLGAARPSVSQQLLFDRLDHRDPGKDPVWGAAHVPHGLDPAVGISVTRGLKRG